METRQPGLGSPEQGQSNYQQESEERFGQEGLEQQISETWEADEQPEEREDADYGNGSDGGAAGDGSAA